MTVPFLWGSSKQHRFFYRNGIIGGKNRKQLRAEVVARSKQDRKEELEFLGIEE